ncbi:hypothetical protein DFP78_108218 [Photobacterium lutimaris]|nr:hypothetical protein DFP78_108218 [Photobacterium lutimaris]
MALEQRRSRAGRIRPKEGAFWAGVCRDCLSGREITDFLQFIP